MTAHRTTWEASGRELDGDQRHVSACDLDGCYLAHGRPSHCLLVDLLTLAMEIYRRVGGGAPLGAATDRPGILYSGGDWAIQSDRALVCGSDRPSAAVYI